MNERFIFTPTPISGVLIAERKDFEDDRGSFAKLFCASEFEKRGVDKPIIQINRSITREKGTTRGLHFQDPPYAETRIISCLKGEVFDITVDLRQGSKTFLSWHAEKLHADRPKSIIIPEGCAHGFQTLTNDCELVYFHTGFYAPEFERGLNVEDKRIGIEWPLPVTGLSERDKSYAPVGGNFLGVSL